VQITDIASEPPSPLSALSSFCTSNTERLFHNGRETVYLIVYLVVSLTFLVYVMGWIAPSFYQSQTTVIMGKFASMSSYEPSAQPCFQSNQRKGTCSNVECKPLSSIDPQSAPFAAYTWYFQDVENGLCYVVAQHPHSRNVSPASIPCWRLPQLGSVTQVGHWRYQHRPAP
jgi:hypothetical protein